MKCLEFTSVRYLNLRKDIKKELCMKKRNWLHTVRDPEALHLLVREAIQQGWEFIQFLNALGPAFALPPARHIARLMTILKNLEEKSNDFERLVLLKGGTCLYDTRNSALLVEAYISAFERDIYEFLRQY